MALDEWWSGHQIVIRRGPCDRDGDHDCDCDCDVDGDSALIVFWEANGSG